MPAFNERKPARQADHHDRPPVAATPAALRAVVARWRRAGERVALVPTMGALHAGHLALLERARATASRTVVSIFVNPTQFSPTEDLDRYPRTFEADRALLAEAGADLVYAPSVADMYPTGFATQITPGGPALAGLEDAARPHFFAGVATVVSKLLLQTLPDVAMFGEKDYQQLQVVRRMVRDLDMPVEVVPVATVREADGLALSSRNRFLSADERRRAVAIPLALCQAVDAIRGGAPIDAALTEGRDTILSAGGALDYFDARNAETLTYAERSDGPPLRLLAAARFGMVRLIDNLAV